LADLIHIDLPFHSPEAPRSSASSSATVPLVFTGEPLLS
jgi:hypothetical protein